MKILVSFLFMYTILMAEMQSTYTKVDKAHCKTVYSELEGYISGERCENFAH